MTDLNIHTLRAGVLFKIMISAQKSRRNPASCCTLWPPSLAISFSCKKLQGPTSCPPFKSGSLLFLLSLERGLGHPNAHLSSRDSAKLSLQDTRLRENSLKRVTDNSCSLLHQELQSMSLLPSEPGRNRTITGPGFLWKNDA